MTSPLTTLAWPDIVGHYEARRVRFTHLQRADEAEPWSRECEAADWEPALHRLLHRRLQWFHEG
jgi:hypothetical protein